MPVVTSIRRPSASRQAGAASTRIVVEIDGEPLATCSDVLVGEFSLRAGRELSPGELDDLVARIGETEAIRVAGQLLSQRLLTAHELRGKLSGRGLGEATVQAAMERLTSDGYVDDERYAVQFVATRTARGHGPRKIQADLARRGVERDIIDNALRTHAAEADASVDGRSGQVAQLVELVQRKYRSANWSERADRDRAARFLAGKGHGWDTIGRVLDQLTD